jgi:hypothetical protein
VSDIEQQLLRLRASTREMMRDELELSSHRSLSALADELIESAISARRDARFRAGERDDG